MFLSPGTNVKAAKSAALMAIPENGSAKVEMKTDLKSVLMLSLNLEYRSNSSSKIVPS
jgi:hypothetical protein